MRCGVLVLVVVVMVVFVLLVYDSNKRGCPIITFLEYLSPTTNILN